MWSADKYNHAIRFAGQWHIGQTIPGTDIAYIVHLAQVCQRAILGAWIDSKLNINLVMQCALLHDVIEDTECTYDIVQAEFGTDIADGVLALSKQTSIDGTPLSKREQMLDSLDRIQRQPKEIWVVKLADRITNLQEPPAHWYKKEGKIAGYLEEANIIFERLSPANDFLAKVLYDKMRLYKRFVPKDSP